MNGVAQRWNNSASCRSDRGDHLPVIPRTARGRATDLAPTLRGELTRPAHEDEGEFLYRACREAKRRQGGVARLLVAS